MEPSDDARFKALIYKRGEGERRVRDLPEVRPDIRVSGRLNVDNGTSDGSSVSTGDDEDLGIIVRPTRPVKVDTPITLAASTHRWAVRKVKSHLADGAEKWRKFKKPPVADTTREASPERPAAKRAASPKRPAATRPPPVAATDAARPIPTRPPPPPPAPVAAAAAAAAPKRPVPSRPPPPPPVAPAARPAPVPPPPPAAVVADAAADADPPAAKRTKRTPRKAAVARKRSPAKTVAPTKRTKPPAKKAADPKDGTKPKPKRPRKKPGTNSKWTESKNEYLARMEAEARAAEAKRLENNESRNLRAERHLEIRERFWRMVNGK